MFIRKLNQVHSYTNQAYKCIESGLNRVLVDHIQFPNNHRFGEIPFNNLHPLRGKLLALKQSLFNIMTSLLVGINKIDSVITEHSNPIDVNSKSTISMCHHD